MSNKYYCLVAGLPDIEIHDDKLYYTSSSFKEYVYEIISDSDKQLLDIIYLKYDNRNILKLLKNTEAEIDDRGIFSKEELQDLILTIKQGDDIKDSRYPKYLKSFLHEYFESNLDDKALLEDKLSSMYYLYCISSKNKFVSEWFEFNLNINNLNIALNSKKYKIDLNKFIVGDNEVANSIRTSNSRDFGVSSMLEYFDEVSKILEMTNMTDRERRFDELKWNWIDDAIFFNNFSIEQILAFMLKTEILERWSSLDKEKGYVRFREAIDLLKKEVQIPIEFR